MEKWIQLLKENVTLSLAIFSAYMYICTYQYEVAYLKEFNIADNVVTLDLNTILKDAVHVLSGLILFFVTYFLILALFSGWSAKSYRHKAFTTLIAQLVAAAATARIFLPFSIKNLSYMALGAIGFIVLLFIIWIIVALSHKPKSEKTDVQIKHQAEKERLSNNYFSRMTWLAYLISYPLMFCQAFGAGEAYRQTDFAIVQDTLKYAVIRKYGEQLICVEIDSNKMLGKKMAIYKLPIVSPIILKHETFGPISTMYLNDNPRFIPKKRAIHR
jgi:hypothetical protein